MRLKNLVKKMLPNSAVHGVARMLVRRRERRLSQLPVQQAFDEVYKKQMWRQGEALSGTGSEGPLAEGYIDFVLKYAREHNLHTVVDGGCGDFSVGSRLAPHFERYAAIDVSPYVIGLNIKRYGELAHVSFSAADLTNTTLPAADLVLIRQVLQHLTNSQIEQVLRNLEASVWQRALIAESVPRPEDNPYPNLELPSHTVMTRCSAGSGVFVDRPPFSREAKRVAMVSGHDGSTLVIFEMTR